MYIIMVLGFMVVLPVASVLIEYVMHDGGNIFALAAKWFVFWALGIRLLLAGIRQVLQPSFTATTIFGIKDPDAEKLVTEIGFGNIAMGTIAASSLLVPDWLVPAGLAGALYLGLAGLKHIANANRTRTENIALISDLGIAAIVAVSLATLVMR